MSSLTLYKYRVFCNDENAFQYWWLDENQPEPTTCPNDSGHTINTALTKIVGVRDPEEIQIKQEVIPTGQNYQWDTQAFDALANSTSTHTFSYDIDVSVLEAQFISATIHKGDKWSWVIAENTTVGALTADVSISDTVLNVSSTVVENIKVGFYINLFDGVNTEDLGRVTAVDTDASTVTVSTASTQAFAAATPTFVQMSIYFMKDVEIGEPWMYIYGEGKIQSSYVPAGTTVKVIYTNMSPTVDKRIVCNLELMY